MWHANSKSFKLGRNLKDMTGQRFGRWVVLRRGGTALKNRVAVWLCRCDCGTEKIVRGQPLRNGQSRSCGCLRNELLGNRTRKEKGEAAFNMLFRSYRKNASTRGMVFTLSKPLFRSLVKQSCAYCGDSPKSIFNGGPRINGVFIYNGVDRIDSKKGYTVDNVVSCCKKCNRVKSALTVDEFISYCKRVIEYYRNHMFHIA